MVWGGEFGRTTDNSTLEVSDESQKAGIRLVAVASQLVEAARRAWRRFGQGNHPPWLNFGDCFPYALAEVTGEPLLFKGKDCAQTDCQIMTIMVR